LSDFFYIWMRPILRDVYSDIFGTVQVPKELELIASPDRHGGREAANAHFESGLQLAFANMHRTTGGEYPLSVYYAFKQQDSGGDDESSSYEDSDDASGMRIEVSASTGWETMLTGLIASGFAINGTWPMRSERGGRMRDLGSNALASSIVLVCRPRPTDAPTTSRRAFVESLRRELPAALKNLQSGNIAPVDLAQASIGPGMAIYSRYSRVLEADGGAMTVRAALGLINQELDAYLAEQDGDIDSDTRFAVAWFEQYAFADGEFGVADTLARAKNTSVAGVSESGLVTAARGKVRLIHWKDYAVDEPYDPAADTRPTVWEAVHHLIHELHVHGETGSAHLIMKLPSDTAAAARDLAYRLYNVCERKGWAEHARDYNALVVSWAGIGEEAARLKQQRDAGDKTNQTRLFE
jgi:putative DNA methylase